MCKLFLENTTNIRIIEKYLENMFIIMRRIFILIISILTIVIPINFVEAANIKQNPKKEREKKVKVIQVYGIVTDDQGNRLDGVDILKVKESDSDYVVGVTTMNGGKYSFFINSDASFMYSKEGYKPQIININGRSEIDVQLKKLNK